MKSPDSLDVARVGLALGAGIVLTLGLFVFMSLLLTTQRLGIRERPPLLVVELTAWSPAVEPAEVEHSRRPSPSVTPPRALVEPGVADEPPDEPEPSAVTMDDVGVGVAVEADEAPPDDNKRAHELITRSLDWIRSRQWEQSDSARAGVFGRFSRDSRTHGPVLGDKRDQILEVYRLPDGNLKVKMVSLLGKIQCFEVAEEDPFDEFSFGVWRLTRC